MISPDKVDYERVKEIAGLVNEVIDDPIEIVGVAKDVLMKAIIETVEAIDDQGQVGRLDPEVIESFNEWTADEAAEPIFPKEEEPATTPVVDPAVEAGEETPPEEKKKKKGRPKKEKPPKPAGEKKKRVGPTPYKSFEELTTWIKEVATPTSAMDKLTLTPHTFDALLSEFKSGYPEFKSFQTVHQIRAHIKYRESKRWVYEYKGEGEKETVQLVGYNG